MPGVKRRSSESRRLARVPRLSSSAQPSPTLNPLIEYVRALPLISPCVLYNVACYYSIAARDDAEHKHAYVKIAFEYLRQSISCSPPLKRRGLLEHAGVDPYLYALGQARRADIALLRHLIPFEETQRNTDL